jgi:hypothetical protein
MFLTFLLCSLHDNGKHCQVSRARVATYSILVALLCLSAVGGQVVTSYWCAPWRASAVVGSAEAPVLA